MTTTRLPQVDKILREQALSALEHSFRRELLADLVREELAALREAGRSESDAQAIAQAVADKAKHLLQPAIRKVVNATGVVLNTNLGRAPLGRDSLSDIVELGSGYCNLEIDLHSGKRGQRSQSIERLLKLLTGAEAGIVVNNNAAAVLLCMSALAKGKSVVVSRGELIEIGGSFRLPDVIQAGGARLHEVGTTNRTRIADYKNALDKRAALILRCHRSNFAIQGFTENVALADLASLAKESAVPLVEDLGSGLLHSLSMIGEREPTVKEVVAQGADLVTFSGDKLLGGPQAGLIVGRRDLVARLAKHPLYRALRLDKLMLSLVERCLIAYLSPHPEKHIPILQLMAQPPEMLKERAARIAATICDAQKQITCVVVPMVATAGGGSLPGETLPSFGIQIAGRNLKANKLQQMLRSLAVPIIAIVDEDRVLLDFRTISQIEEKLLIDGILEIARRLP